HERAPVRPEELREIDLPHAPGRGVPFVERVVRRHLTAERQRPPLCRDGLDLAAQVEAGPEEIVPGSAIVLALTGEANVVKRHASPPVRWCLPSGGRLVSGGRHSSASPSRARTNPIEWRQASSAWERRLCGSSATKPS